MAVVPEDFASSLPISTAEYFFSTSVNTLDGPSDPTLVPGPLPDFTDGGTGFDSPAAPALGLGALGGLVVGGAAFLFFGVAAFPAVAIGLLAGGLIAGVAWLLSGPSAVRNLLPEPLIWLTDRIPEPVAKALVAVTSSLALYLLVAFIFAGWTPARALTEFRNFVGV